MKEMPKVGFVCSGENALELSGAICCAGRLMRYFNEKGFVTGGCYSCISPSKQERTLEKRMCDLCLCNDVVVTVGCEGFRPCDVSPDITEKLGERSLTHISEILNRDSYPDSGDRLVRCFPSRAVSVMYDKCVIINLPSDTKTALGRMKGVINHVSYIVNSMGEKRTGESSNLADLTWDYLFK